MIIIDQEKKNDWVTRDRNIFNISKYILLSMEFITAEIYELYSNKEQLEIMAIATKIWVANYLKLKQILSNKNTKG